MRVPFRAKKQPKRDVDGLPGIDKQYSRTSRAEAKSRINALRNALIDGKIPQPLSHEIAWLIAHAHWMRTSMDKALMMVQRMQAVLSAARICVHPAERDLRGALDVLRRNVASADAWQSDMKDVRIQEDEDE